MATELAAAFHVFSDADATSVELALAIASLAEDSVRQHGRFTIALSGGQSPRRLYTVLARNYGRVVPWQGVHVFWGDERYVHLKHPLSNYRMARETLLDHVPVPPQNIHPIPTTLPTPENAASAYEAELRRCFDLFPPRFDLILLGLGTDGHIASLFPGSEALNERKRAVVAVRDLSSGPARLTLTFPVLNNAARIYFLVIGKDKAKALKDALVPDGDPLLCPARGVRPHEGEVVFWTDRQAASLVGIEGLAGSQKRRRLRSG